MKICPNCSHRNVTESTFCAACGTWLPESSYRPDPVPVNPGIQNYQPVKKSHAGAIVAVILAVLLVAGGAVGAVVYLYNTQRIGNHADTASTVTAAVTEAATEAGTVPTTESSGSVMVGNSEETSAATAAQLNTFDDPDAFIFPSDSEMITEEYLDTLSKEQIDLIRNEIYARHGYIFQKEVYYNYFSGKTWYRPTEPDMDTAAEGFNSTERKNIDIIVIYQREH